MAGGLWRRRISSMKFDRETYFDAVRQNPFGGQLSQSQVDAQEQLLANFELDIYAKYADLRWIAYMLATTFHETAQTMQPISEYGHGEGHEYGIEDPETGQTYYGRGYVQLTWRDNYRRATQKLELFGADDLEWHAGQALEPGIAFEVMAVGMTEGWFTGEALPDYFNEMTDDPVNARAIINNDVASMGETIAGYYHAFLTALQGALIKEPAEPTIDIALMTTGRVTISVTLNGELVLAAGV
jgi:hypothetical protein